MNIEKQEKFAKLFEVNGDQILVVKESIDDDETGESDPGIVFRFMKGGHTLNQSFTYENNKLRDEAFDRINEDVANGFRLEAVETFKDLLGN